MNKKYRSGTTDPTGKSAKITTGAPSNDIPYHSTQQAAYRQIHRNIIPLIKKRYQVYIVIKTTTVPTTAKQRIIIKLRRRLRSGELKASNNALQTTK